MAGGGNYSMKKNALFFVIVSIIVCNSSALYAYGSAAVQMASDARAASMAGSYTAVASDLSALIYNPAGLAFVPVRQLSIAAEGMGQSTVSSFAGTAKNSSLMRLRIGQAGLIHAIPTERGGITLAVGFQSPYSFDDCVTTTGAFSAGSGRDSIYKAFKTLGELSFWSAGFGIQIAPGLGAGVAAALVSGSEQERSVFEKRINGAIAAPAIDKDFDRQTERVYLGYDLRGGLLYAFNDIVKAGLMLSIPQMLFFWESVDESYPHSAFSGFTEKSTGTMYSAWNLALGAQTQLPFMTLSLDGHIRAPYMLSMPNENIPEQSPAALVHRGAGIGAEIPAGSWVFRGGYAIEDVDFFKFVRIYDNRTDPVYWDTDGLKADSYRQTGSGGIGYMAAGGNVCIEAGYSHSWWILSTRSTAVENHAQDRFSLSLSFRY